MRRRHTLKATLASLLPLSWRISRAQPASGLAALLRAGRCVVMLRHAQTEPGVGDPPDFQPGQCSTQRNLSQAGRAQASRIGQWFRNYELQTPSVYASAWCRCRDTADLAFGQHSVLPALNSTFDNKDHQAAQTLALRARLQGVPAGRFEVWVTHQVNITALTGEVPAMAEALVIHGQGTVLARTTFG